MNIRTKETLPEVQAESTDNAENNVTQTRYAQKTFAEMRYNI